MFQVADFEDLSGGNPFADAVQGVDGVIHTASPFHYNVTNVEKELVGPAINGTKMMLEAASNAKSVQRLIVTSSFAAVGDFSKNPGPDFTYTANDWNPITYEETVAANPHIGYIGSKKLAERAAWDYVEEKKPHYDLVTLCPPYVFGPMVHPISSTSQLNTSNALIWDVAAGKPVNDAPVPLWVDVRDLAKAHVESLLRPEAGGKRYTVVASDKFSFHYEAKLLKELGLGKPADYDESKLESVGFSLDNAPARNELGIEFKTFDQTIRDSIPQFLSLDN